MQIYQKNDKILYKCIEVVSLKKIDYIIIFIVVLISIGFYSLYYRAYKINGSDQLYVEILYKNNLVNKIYLTKDTNQVINIDRDGHHNQITITYDSITMSEADCPDKYCMRMFLSHRHFTPIICTNGVVVRIVGQSPDQNVDIVVP